MPRRAPMLFFEFDDRELALDAVGDELDLLAFLHLGDELGVGAEHHGHGGHAEVLELLVDQGDLAGIGVDRLDATLGVGRVLREERGRDGGEGEGGRHGGRKNERFHGRFLFEGQGTESSGSVDDQRPVHAAFVVTGDQAGVLEGAVIGEGPDDLAGLARLEPDGVRIVVLHVGELLHHRLVLGDLLGRIEDELVLEVAGVGDHDAHGLALLEGEVARLEQHLGILGLDHRDLDGAVDLRGVAGHADGHLVAMAAIVVAGREDGGCERHQGGGQDQVLHGASLGWVW